MYLSLVFARSQLKFQAEGNLRKMEGSQVRLEGRISSEPILQGMSQRFKMGKINVQVARYPEYRYGDRVAVFGSLQRKVVNKWYSRFSLIYPTVSKIKPDRVNFIGFDWKELVMRFRRRIEGVYNRSIPEPEASLLAGIVLGAKRSLPRSFWESLQRTGTLHIVVASGYNVTVVIGVVVGYLAGILKRRTAVFVGFLAVLGYTVMAGAEPAIVRAAIMGSLVYFGQVLGRKADGVRLLVGAVGLMILYDPMIVFDVGFQLSAGATAGLLFISPLLKVGKDVSESLAAQLAVWPILIITFGSVSVFSVVVNGLILWLVPIVMSLGAGLAMVGLVSGSLGRVVGWFTYIPLTMMVRVIEWFSKKSFMSFEVGEISWWWGVGYYFVLVVVVGWLSRRERRLN